MTTGQTFLVQRSDLSQARIDAFDAEAPLAPGQVRLRVEHFALTANNITYAVFGESMHYWRFFPAAEGWGCIPVWGFAVIEAAACDGVVAGERFFGYWPMASHAVVQPASVSEHGFIDASAHRAELPAAYNRYQRVEKARCTARRRSRRAAAAFRHRLADRGLHAASRRLRRAHDAAVERLEQDGVRNGVLLEAQGSGDAHRRRHIAGAARVGVDARRVR
jgi:Protein of unknown function (DUF2855)